MMGRSEHPLYTSLPDSFEERAPEPVVNEKTPRGSWDIAIVIGIALTVVGAIVGFVVPKFGETFEQIGFVLPPMTQALFTISGFVSAHPWAWLLGTIAISWWAGHVKKRRGLIEFLAIMVLFVSVVFIVIALFLPLLTPIECLSIREGWEHPAESSPRTSIIV